MVQLDAHNALPENIVHLLINLQSLVHLEHTLLLAQPYVQDVMMVISVKVVRPLLHLLVKRVQMDSSVILLKWHVTIIYLAQLVISSKQVVILFQEKQHVKFVLQVHTAQLAVLPLLLVLLVIIVLLELNIVQNIHVQKELLMERHLELVLLVVRHVLLENIVQEELQHHSIVPQVHIVYLELEIHFNRSAQVVPSQEIPHYQPQVNAQLVQQDIIAQ